MPGSGAFTDFLFTDHENLCRPLHEVASEWVSEYTNELKGFESDD